MSTSMERYQGNGPFVTAFPSTAEKRAHAEVVEVVTRPGTGSSQPLFAVNSPQERGVRRRFPWCGFSALVVVILCVVATILVLRFSDNKQASKWCYGRIAPNVFLSLFSNVSNVFITIMLGNGIAIAWWRRVSQSKDDLHYSWSIHADFWQIFRHLKSFNLIALAVLGAKIAIVDSVLYQKALGTVIDYADPENHTDYASFAANTFPITAVMGESNSSTGSFADNFSFDTLSWMSMPLLTTTPLSILACLAHECTFGMEAAGFAVDCDISKKPVDYGVSGPLALSLNQSDGYQNLPLFSIGWSYAEPDEKKNYSRIVLNSTFADRVDEELGENGTSLAVKDGTCPTNMTNLLCEFRPAVLNYTVIQTNQKSKPKSDKSHKSRNQEDSTDGWNPQQPWKQQLDTFDQLGFSCNDSWCGVHNQSWQQLAGVQVIRYMDVSERFLAGANSSLFGFYLTFRDFFTASATASWDGQTWSHSENGSFAFWGGVGHDVPSGYCNYTYDSPLSLLLTQINMLSASVAMDPAAYYEYNSDDNNPLWLAYYNDKSSEDFNDFVNKHNYSAFDVFNYTYDIHQPKGGFDPQQATIKNTPVQLTFKDIFYTISWSYVWGAVIATVFILLCILPVYWGFWNLEHEASLDPTEIAKVLHTFGSESTTSVPTEAGSGETGYPREGWKIMRENKDKMFDPVKEGLKGAFGA